MLDYPPSKFDIVGLTCWLGHHSHSISCITLNHNFFSKPHCSRVLTIRMITKTFFYLHNIMNTMIDMTMFTSPK
jgi:hypothetical protein